MNEEEISECEYCGNHVKHPAYEEGDEECKRMMKDRIKDLEATLTSDELEKQMGNMNLSRSCVLCEEVSDFDKWLKATLAVGNIDSVVLRVHDDKNPKKVLGSWGRNQLTQIPSEKIIAYIHTSAKEHFDSLIDAEADEDRKYYAFCRIENVNVDNSGSLIWRGFTISAKDRIPVKVQDKKDNEIDKIYIELSRQTKILDQIADILGMRLPK